MSRHRLRPALSQWMHRGNELDEVAPYEDILVNTYGADEVWPLVDISSGTTINAHVDSNRNGTLTGWDLQNAAGPVTGTLAPYSDGINDVGRIGTAGLDAIFDGAEGNVFIWAKPINAAYWADPALGMLLKLRANGNNNIQLYKSGSSAGLTFQYRAGGGATELHLDTALNGTSAWFSGGASWSKLANETKLYANGVQNVATKTSSGVWAGSINNDTTNIGAANAVPTTVWNGWLAFAAVKFGSIWTPANFLAMHNAVT